MLRPRVSQDLWVKAIAPRRIKVSAAPLVARDRGALRRRPRAGIEEDPLARLEPLRDLDLPAVALPISTSRLSAPPAAGT